MAGVNLFTQNISKNQDPCNHHSGKDERWPLKTSRVWWFYHLMADSPSFRTIGSRSFLGTFFFRLQLLLFLLWQNWTFYVIHLGVQVSFGGGDSLLFGSAMYLDPFHKGAQSLPLKIKHMSWFFCTQVQPATATGLQGRSTLPKTDLQVSILEAALNVEQ